MATATLNRLSDLGAKIRRSAETINRSEISNRLNINQQYYQLLRAYYSSEVYERSDCNVQAIKAWEGLPRYIRPIVLVARRAVEWWPGHLFPGAWTPDGLPASNGRPNMVSYDRDTPDLVRLAVQQAYDWGNGPRFLRHFGRVGPMLGNVFAEAMIDYDRNKVYPTLVNPEFVVEVEFNPAGDLTMYRLAIPKHDAMSDRQYIYGKRVTRESYTTYKDDVEFSFVEGQSPEIENPFGFVPAVFPPHVDTGGPHGASAIDGTLPLLDEINGVVSQIDDYIMRIANQSVIIESPNPSQLKQALSQQAATPRQSTNSRTDYQAGRQEVGILPAPTGTAVHHLLEDIGLAASDVHISRLEREIEKCFPEIVLSDKLLEMSQVTRPGAIPLVQDVQHKFDESAGNYYDAITSLGQMLVSMGGHLARSGAWGFKSDLTPDQQKFLPFDLSSFDKGDLDFSILPGELIPKSFQELINESLALENIKTVTGRRLAGMGEDDNAALAAELERNQVNASAFLGQAFGSGAV